MKFKTIFIKRTISTGCPRIQKGTNLGGGKTIPEGEIVDSRGIFESFFFSSINPKTFSDSLFIYDKFVTIKDLTSDTSSMKKQAQEPGDE
jgi:hypothetical protein